MDTVSADMLSAFRPQPGADLPDAGALSLPRLWGIPPDTFHSSAIPPGVLSTIQRPPLTIACLPHPLPASPFSEAVSRAMAAITGTQSASVSQLPADLLTQLRRGPDGQLPTEGLPVGGAVWCGLLGGQKGVCQGSGGSPLHHRRLVGQRHSLTSDTWGSFVLLPNQESFKYLPHANSSRRQLIFFCNWGWLGATCPLQVNAKLWSIGFRPCIPSSDVLSMGMVGFN